jgi:hypothetical protein
MAFSFILSVPVYNLVISVGYPPFCWFLRWLLVQVVMVWKGAPEEPNCNVYVVHVGES